MRLASFQIDDRVSWGVIDDEVIRDLGASSPAPTLTEALATGAHIGADPAAAPAEPLASATLLPPIVRGAKILCIGLNYADHIAEMGRETPTKPTVFPRFEDSIVGAGEALVAPRNSGRFDYEGEFAVVIGRGGRHISPDAATDHVLGYTIVNDGSMRDYQRHTTQFTPGKNFPRSGSAGPWIVTADEFGAIGDQRIETRVNDLVVQSSSIDQLAFGVPELIAYLSEWTELRPGDVVATGTPGGVGDGRTPALYLFPGDVVSVDVAGIGTLTNPVVEEA